MTEFVEEVRLDVCESGDVDGETESGVVSETESDVNVEEEEEGVETKCGHKSIMYI